MNSNFQYAGAVNLVVGPFGWVVLCDPVRSGRGASGTARYQRRGWAILAAGLGAAHRRSDLWCARLGSTRSNDRLLSAASKLVTDTASSLRVRVSASSSRPRTACRSSRRAPPSFGPEARTYGRSSPPVEERPARGAVCRFVDPIADIAVLGSPNAPHADDYKALMATATALPIADRVRHPVNFWAPARAAVARRPVVLLDHPPLRRAAVDHPRRRARPRGISGSPIVAETGTAIGVVCTTTSPREGGPPRSR
jgi:hypothetical protein